jgi:hypothetical protein
MRLKSHDMGKYRIELSDIVHKKYGLTNAWFQIFISSTYISQDLFYLPSFHPEKLSFHGE